ncbi:MAG: hypothetical protein M0004_05900 [Actinomycetota bacterium]|nr:hypothetical protein [Actinomycetota bacterium]
MVGLEVELSNAVMHDGLPPGAEVGVTAIQVDPVHHSSPPPPFKLQSCTVMLENRLPLATSISKYSPVARNEGVVVGSLAY